MGSCPGPSKCSGTWDPLKLGQPPTVHSQNCRLVSEGLTTYTLSFMAIFLLGVIPFHNLEMTASYVAFEASLAEALGVSVILVRTVAFLIMGAVAVAIFSGFSLLARWRAGDSQYGFQRMAIWFALPFIPLAISLHVAHNYFHILEEGAIIIPNLSDPFGFGWNLLGTAGASVTLLSSNVISLLQFLTIGFGALATGYLLFRLTSNMFTERGKAFRSMVPMSVFLVGLAAFYAWVLTIPMSMRF